MQNSSWYMENRSFCFFSKSPKRCLCLDSCKILTQPWPLCGWEVSFTDCVESNTYISRNVCINQVISTHIDIFYVRGPNHWDVPEKNKVPIHDDVIKWRHFPRHRPFTVRWIPLTKASDAQFWCFRWSAFEKKRLKNANRGAVDLRRHGAHYAATVTIHWRCNQGYNY